MAFMGGLYAQPPHVTSLRFAQNGRLRFARTQPSQSRRPPRFAPTTRPKPQRHSFHRRRCLCGADDPRATVPWRCEVEDPVSADSVPQQEADVPRSWWREAEVAVLIVLVVAAYLLRIGDVSMRGEESRRARVAFEMLERGDWIVPREQGQPFLSRPPLQNWLIAASRVVCGSAAAVGRASALGAGHAADRLADLRLCAHLPVACRRPGGGRCLRHLRRDVHDRLPGRDGNDLHQPGQCFASALALGAHARLVGLRRRGPSATSVLDSACCARGRNRRCTF